MKRQTKKMLKRVGAAAAAIAVTLGIAYSANRMPPSVPASTDGSEPRVIILDAGHGECA